MRGPGVGGLRRRRRSRLAGSSCRRHRPPIRQRPASPGRSRTSSGLRPSAAGPLRPDQQRAAEPLTGRVTVVGGRGTADLLAAARSTLVMWPGAHQRETGSTSYGPWVPAAPSKVNRSVSTGAVARKAGCDVGGNHRRHCTDCRVAFSATNRKRPGVALGRAVAGPLISVSGGASRARRPPRSSVRQGERPCRVRRPAALLQDRGT